MSAKNDGGPAFARPYAEGQSGETFSHAYMGMSLRDYFAAAALTGLMAPIPYDSDLNCRRIAADAYFLADAMLARRKKGADDGTT